MHGFVFMVPLLTSEGDFVVEALRAGSAAGRLLRLRGGGILRRRNEERHILGARLTRVNPRRELVFDVINFDLAEIIGGLL